MSDRILHKGLKAKVMSAEAAAALIPNGAVVGMCGFTGAGYPKAVPIALAKRAVDERLKGKPFKARRAHRRLHRPGAGHDDGHRGGERFRFPYQGDAVTREKINAGVIEYQDMHLSATPGRSSGTATTARTTRSTSPSSRSRRSARTARSSPRPRSARTTSTSSTADKIILEVNEWQDERLEGMHDIISIPGKHGDRVPIPLLTADDRVGSPY